MNYVGEDVYITREGLYMTLVSNKEFLDICRENGLHLLCPPMEEVKDVGTGNRSILRFELRKLK